MNKNLPPPFVRKPDQVKCATVYGNDPGTIADSRIYKPSTTSIADESSSSSSSTRAQYLQLTEEFSRYKIYFPRRYIVWILTFSGMFLMNSLRVNLSVAIVAMTTNRPVMLDNGTTIQVKEFNWNSKEKGFLLSSYFYGFAISEFPSGWLAGRFGGRATFGVEMLCAALCNFLIPTIAGYGLHALFVSRLLLGIFEGGSIPSICGMWSHWAPPAERTTLMSSSVLGATSSNVVCFFLYGNLCANYGWRILFYLPGSITILWCAIWFKFVKNRPADDKSISQRELQYIQSAMRGGSENKVIYPWKSLLTSSAVWSAVLGFIPHAWTFFFLSIELPSYFNDVWKINVKESGLIITIAFAISLVFDVMSALMADCLIDKKKYSATLVRKLIHGTGGFGVAVFFFLIGNSASQVEATIFLIVTTCFSSLFYGSIFSAPMDLAPPYASLIMGMMTATASVAVTIAPVLTGYVTTHQSKEEWFIPFAITSGVCTVGTVIYLILGSGEVQHWAVETNADDEASAPMDLAPPYASLIMGMMTTTGSVALAISPVVTGYVTTHQSKEEWFIPFAITSGVCTVGTVIYLILGSGEVQHWAVETNADNET